MKAHLHTARVSPKKMNLIAGMVRGKKVSDALNQLKFTPKKAARLLFKAISSAVANASNNFKQEPDKLYIKNIMVNKGIVYKRGLPVSRGRYHRILKRNTNLTVEVGLEEPEKVKSGKQDSEKRES